MMTRALLLALTLAACATEPAFAQPYTPTNGYAKDVCSETDSPRACIRAARARYREIRQQGFNHCVATSLAEMPGADQAERRRVVWLCSPTDLRP